MTDSDPFHLFFFFLYLLKLNMLSAEPAYALARATFKRAQRGLFGGKHIQFGNNVMKGYELYMFRFFFFY